MGNGIFIRTLVPVFFTTALAGFALAGCQENGEGADGEAEGQDLSQDDGADQGQDPAGDELVGDVAGDEASDDGAAAQDPPIDDATGDDAPPPPPGTWVSGYYACWYPEMYPPELIDCDSLTHLMLARAELGDGGEVPAGRIEWALSDAGIDACTEAIARCKAAGRKAVVMIGGAGSGGFFLASAADAVRATTVQSILEFMDGNDLDGADIDWEDSIDRDLLLALVRDLRTARPDMIITFPGGWLNTNADVPPDPYWATLAEQVDQFNVMSYGMAGPWGGWVTWHFAALAGESSDHPSSVSSTANGYAATGIPAGKIGIGMGFYGMNYGPPNTAPLQEVQGSFGSDDNEWRYNNLAGRGYLDNGTYTWDDAAGMGYRSYAGGYTPPGGSTAGFLSYEDERSIEAKGQWVRDNGFGGAIIWTINYGCTNSATGENTLLDAARRAFLE